MPIDSRTTAFVFPGQGSQFVGMGKALAQADPQAAELFARADLLLGLPLSTLCWEGPAETLNETVNTQPALLVHSLAALGALQRRFPSLRPAMVAGHSMGEFSALVAAGAVGFDEALRLVLERGRAMQAAGQQQPGGMAAILGLDVERVADVCAAASSAASGVVQVANDNCPGQVVISGENAALDAALEALTAAGAKRAVRLAVSIGAHSPLMQPAQERLNRALAASGLSDPQVPIVGNVAAAMLTTAEAVRQDLQAQLTSRVRWTESILAMRAAGITTYLELGAGNVLCGLIRRIDRTAVTLAVDSIESLEPLAA
ncbi:MAG: ACP S-malonyltransferase [Chloroflexi bacterium]|nr:ACP S-malonyltransferase [Chloroflexota bacterium]